MYTRAFVKIYNQRYRRLVHETHEMVKFQKYLILRAENLLNLGSQYLTFYKVLILC